MAEIFFLILSHGPSILTNCIPIQNTGNQSAAESPFGGIKQSGMGKESGKDVAINEFLIQKTGTLTLQDHY